MYDKMIDTILDMQRESDMTLKQLSEIVGIDESTLHRNIKNKTMSLQTFVNIARVLGFKEVMQRIMQDID